MSQVTFETPHRRYISKVRLRHHVLGAAPGGTTREGTLGRKYKLRLSDGTTLAVDFEGLRPWLIDARAMVQISGSREWRPLKEVLAEALVAAKYAARKPGEPSKSRKKRGGRADLPLVPPPGPPPTEAPAGAPIGAPNVQSLADDPGHPEGPGPADASPLILLKPREGEAPRFGAPPQDEGPRLAFIDAAREPAAPSPAPVAEAPAEPPTPPPPPVGVAAPPDHEAFGDAFIDEPPGLAAPEDELLEVLTDHPVLQTSPPTEIEGLVEPPVAPSVIVPAPPADDEPSILLTPGDGGPPPADLLRPEPTEIELPSPVRVVVGVPVTRPAAAAAAADEGTALPPPVAEAAREAPRAHAAADDPAAPVAERPHTPPTPDDSLPIIPLKPLDAEPPAPSAPRPRPAPRAVPMERVGDFEVEPVGRGPVAQTLLAAAAVLGTLLSRFLEPIGRLERGEPLIDAEAPPRVGPAFQRLRAHASTWAGSVAARVGRLVPGAGRPDPDGSVPTTEVPLVPPPPAAHRSAPEEKTASLFASRLAAVPGVVSSWAGAMRDGIRRLARPVRPEPARPEPRSESEPPWSAPEAFPIEPVATPVESPSYSVERLTAPLMDTEPDPPEPPAAPPPTVPARESRAPASPPSRVMKPPPSIGDLPSIPLARRQEPRETDDVDEAPDPGGWLLAAWAWTRSGLTILAFGGGVTFAAWSWSSWSPRAAEVGRQAFVEIDKYARSSKEQNEALARATREVPQLAPETILMVLHSSPTGLLEPVDVFRIATEATERGRGTLTVEEAEEVDALRTALVATLTPTERLSVREYEDTRARRVVFPVENASALRLYARGARALSPARRGRLQVLLGKTVAAGLASADAES